MVKTKTVRFWKTLWARAEIFKLSKNLSLTHLRAQSPCYELKGDLSPVMLREIFHDSLKISKLTRICRVFLQVPSSQKKRRNQTIEFSWELYCLVVLFLLFYVICASVPTEGTDLYGKPFKLHWVAKIVFLIQILLIFGGRCNRYF